MRHRGAWWESNGTADGVQQTGPYLRKDTNKGSIFVIWPLSLREFSALGKRNPIWFSGKRSSVNIRRAVVSWRLIKRKRTSMTTWSGWIEAKGLRWNGWETNIKIKNAYKVVGTGTMLLFDFHFKCFYYSHRGSWVIKEIISIYRTLYNYFIFPQILWMGQNLCGSRICSFFAIGYCKRIWEYTNWLLSDLDRFSGFRVSNFRASPWFHNSHPCKFHASILLIFYSGMSNVWQGLLPHLLDLSIYLFLLLSNIKYLFLPYSPHPVTSGLDKELRKKITKDLRFP